jgi:FMN phosphatase YigB (HAD superfamily)
MAHNSNAADTSTLPPPIIHEFAPVAAELLACGARPAFLQGPQGPAISQKIEAEIDRSGASILSFDVFDTFLLRNDKPETLRYFELSTALHERLLGKYGGKTPSAMDLLFARLTALTFSYRTSKAVDGCREGNLGQVIRVARTALGLDEDVEALFLETELDYEAANLTINPILAGISTAHRAIGGKVILVSDMYLSGDHIAALVSRVGGKNAPAVDGIFSSADTIVSKRSGKVFKQVEKTMDAAATDFLHVGDAWEGDVVRCREAGWHTLHFPIARAELVRRQQALQRFVADMRSNGQDVSRWAQL